ncbi:Oidioi.mRNA.OKI2018_I69.XSR.g16558.t1.cds [Oikopleura dioica]|uniref:Oidioi.mRNA.OKI2018_I69.XSR.g16558.t1.cds n=1 Tax=Oikopleura dioica TaxID=34765 RepID=A0ABN7SGZ4_OIKDI|nr:Oidioi.mRNA.OKI2018_I69.XSR.g16558.t1.cds [Oikopleura dioica]
MSSVEDFSYIADSCREQANTTSRDLLDSPPAAKKKKVINLRQYARQPGEGIKQEIKEEYKEEKETSPKKKMKPKKAKTLYEDKNLAWRKDPSDFESYPFCAYFGDQVPPKKKSVMVHAGRALWIRKTMDQDQQI